MVYYAITNFISLLAFLSIMIFQYVLFTVSKVYLLFPQVNSGVSHSVNEPVAV